MRRTMQALLTGAAVLPLVACSGTDEPELALLGQAPAELPTWAGDTEGLPVTDLTQVADVDNLIVFASRDDGEDWCVVMAIEPTAEGTDWSLLASCAPSEAFAAHGVMVEGAGSGNHGGALLLPDDFSGEIPEHWEQVNDNLAIR